MPSAAPPPASPSTPAEPPGAGATSAPGSSPWAPPPSPTPSLFAPLPHAAPARLLLAAVAVGVLAAGLLVVPRPGVGVPLVVLAGAVACVVARPRAAVRTDRGARVLAVLGLALTAVPALRDSPWLVALCLVAAAALLAAALVGARSWPSLVLAVPVLAGVAGPALAWTARRLRGLGRPEHPASWVRGALVGVGAAVVVGSLLVSGDVAFARVVEGLAEAAAPRNAVLRVAVLAAAAACVLLAVAVRAAPPRWQVFDGVARSRPAAEWAVPLALVDAVLGLFVVVQASVLFGLYDPAAAGPGDTYAGRARQGFAQLVVVTLLVLALLTWASRRCDGSSRSDRRLLAGLGGTLVVLGLVLVASALQRMWLYEQAYGSTVLRVVVAVGEVWLGLVLAGSALAWGMRRTAGLPRAVTASAGAVLLALALAGPDAVVARANVERFARTGELDVAYLSRLSDDAVPELARLPEPYRSCVLAPSRWRASVADDPWSGRSLARVRAREAWTTATATTSTTGCPSPFGRPQ